MENETFAKFVFAAITVPVFAVRPIVKTNVSAAGTTAPRTIKLTFDEGDANEPVGITIKLNEAFDAV